MIQFSYGLYPALTVYTDDDARLVNLRRAFAKLRRVPHYSCYVKIFMHLE